LYALFLTYSPNEDFSVSAEGFIRTIQNFSITGLKAVMT